LSLILPGLTERIGLPSVQAEPGKFVPPQGVPLASLSLEQKKEIPPEIVFAKTGGQLIDLNINLSITEKGQPEQKISTLSNKPLQLVVKPEAKVKKVKGYLIFKSKPKGSSEENPRILGMELPLNYFLGSIIFSAPVLAKAHDPAEIETVLVLMEFEYTDEDGDGIYTADIQTPLVEGEYEIITVMDYENPDLGQKEIRLVTVVDPEGYVYARMAGGIKGRIPGAVVSLYWLNPQDKQYVLWPAEDYQQENPQITDDTGKIFVFSAGRSILFKSRSPNYLEYQAILLLLKEGSGIHQNIELKSKSFWLRFDWRTILLILPLFYY